MRQSEGPICPNHEVALIDLPNPMTTKGVGVCPISGCSFDFEADIATVKNERDRNGNIIKTYAWKSVGED